MNHIMHSTVQDFQEELSQNRAKFVSEKNGQPVVRLMDMTERKQEDIYSTMSYFVLITTEKWSGSVMLCKVLVGTMRYYALRNGIEEESRISLAKDTQAYRKEVETLLLILNTDVRRGAYSVDFPREKIVHAFAKKINFPKENPA